MIPPSLINSDPALPFYGQADTSGEVAQVTTDVYSLVRCLKSPSSSLAVLGIVRKILLSELATRLPFDMVEHLLAQDIEILRQVAVEVLPEKQGDA